MRAIALRISGIALLLLALMLGDPVMAEKRAALVIGNSVYKTVTTLKNPTNDASDIAAALETLDFEVFLGKDLGRDAMTDLIDRYTLAAEDADVSLFYYAGHGFQINSKNYLVPTDAQVVKPEDIVAQSFDLDAIMAKLQRSSGIRLVFLDACRNNPLSGLPGVAGAAVSDGLARIGSAADFLFAFATQPDNVAYDGIDRNSYFTEAVLSHIFTPGQDIADLMISVRKDVLAATGGKQIPWESSSLTRQFSFDTGPVTASPETLFWQIAANARDPLLMRLYLERYPEGAHVADVRRFLNTDLASATTSATDSNRRLLSGQDEPGGQADMLWQLVQRTRMRPLAEFYLEQYPDGPQSVDVRRLLTTLPAQSEISPSRLCEQFATHPRDATANTAGIPFEKLAQNAASSVEACSAAVRASPEVPHYKALLARATAAAGNRDAAISLYREAAALGDLRAMVSLGLITETGDGIIKDLPAAIALYEQAAAGGSPDGAINLAVALFGGAGIERNVPRAIELLVGASDAGSAIATYNLGVLAQDGVTGNEGEAIDYFRKAARDGESRGFLAAAILLDEGRGVARDPAGAADMILRGAAADNGEVLNQMTQSAANWSAGTIAAVQAKLQKAGYYEGPLDGLSGPRFAAALQTWRNGGFLGSVLDG